jgi:hypothetical protein
MTDLLNTLKIARDELVSPSRGPSGSRPVIDQIGEVIHATEMRRLGFEDNVQRVPLADRDALLQELNSVVTAVCTAAAFLAGRNYVGLGRTSRASAEHDVIEAIREVRLVRERISAALAAGTSDGLMADALNSLLADEANPEIQAAKDTLFRLAPEIPTVARIALRIHKTGA